MDAYVEGDRVLVIKSPSRWEGAIGTVTNNLGPGPARDMGAAGDALFVKLDDGRVAAVTSEEVAAVIKDNTQAQAA